MNIKTTFSIGIFTILTFPFVTTLAADKINTQLQSMRMLEQARDSIQKENQYRSFAALENNNNTNEYQNKSRNMYGSDNDTGQGTKTRTRSRDGSGSGNQKRYGQSSNNSSVANRYGSGGSGSRGRH